ncbi:Polyketide synthase PksJ [Rhizoctonia solani]|uniref:Polyketide synthase PksJ n=1 Tax=Rhizoctonia solani TaxID=456999 RepID=A0A0K6G7N8_9AGAM|nr:Polyketide synthase PksJ [Rhizoctonia solani]
MDIDVPTQPSFTQQILEQIEEHRNSSGGFRNPSELKESELLLLLRTVLSTLSLLPGDPGACWSHLSNPDNFFLVLDLQLAYAANNFSLVENHASFKCFRGENVDVPMATVPMKKSDSSGSQDLKDAFKETYIGDLPKLFKEILDEYGESVFGFEASERPYNKSVPIIQSSGMGKSRLAGETGKLVFTIPINLREFLPSSVATYPPADNIMRAYFGLPESDSDELLQVRYAILLKSLFDLVAPLAEQISKRYTTEGGAKLWAEYLEEDQTLETVGPRRELLYRTVVENALDMSAQVKTKQVILSQEITDRITTLDVSEKVKTYFSSLSTSCSRFCEAVRPTLERQKQVGNTAMVYFDEAQSLTAFPSKPGPLRRMSPYHNLGKVLAELINQRVFFVFLSTNSNLQQLAPAPYDHPSLRVAKGSIVFPPFTELSFDAFDELAFEVLGRSTKGPSLEDVCTTRVISYFGRPMWHVHHQVWREQQQKQQKKKQQQQDPSESSPVNDVITFAVDKIIAHGNPKKSAASNLACIGIRVGITFNSGTWSSRQMEANHVESHMRVIYAIPAHREYMRTGSPSEPILAEAAARKLERCNGTILEAGPRILAENCQAGYLVRRERGELCGRLLLTIAHDLVIKELPDSPDHEPKYHRPIPVLAFLRALFATSHHDIILDATPMRSSVPSKTRTLGEAFKNAYISFSHFEIARDSKVLDASQLPYSLIRGFAIQAKDKQDSIDAVIPIHMGDVTDPITPETTSAISLQFKNRENARHCSVDRSITVPDTSLPMISIVLELGEEDPSPPLVRVGGASDQDALNEVNHYTLIARGHGPETFNAVTATSKPFYDVILGTKDILDDFPRADKKGLTKYLKNTMLLRHDRTAARLATLQSRETILAGI